MQGEKEKARDQTEGSGQQQQPVGQDSNRSEYGPVGDPPEPGAGSAPPRSMGVKRGTEVGHTADRGKAGQQGQSGTGQADLGSQAGSTLAGHTEQEDLGELGGEIDQPGSYAGGMSGRQVEGDGFQPGADTDEYGISGQDFVREGQGAVENTVESGSGDVERERERTQNRDSDIEGGSGSI